MTETQRAAMQAALQLCENLHGAELRSGLKIRTEPTAKQLRAALAEDTLGEPGGRVQGWKLVPEQPTEEMLAATSWPGCAATDYAHMISAAPAPPRREWQGLTDEEREQFVQWMHPDVLERVEAALRAKNGGGE